MMKEWLLIMNVPPGLLPMVQWMISIERKPPVTRKLHTIQRLQGWSMLGYYPFEHVYWFLSHSIIPSVVTLPSFSGALASSSEKLHQKKVTLDPGQLSRVSCRFWLVYIFLQFLQYGEDQRSLIRKERELRKSKVSSFFPGELRSSNGGGNKTGYLRGK